MLWITAGRTLKQGTPSTHPILGDELRALRRLQLAMVQSTAKCMTSVSRACWLGRPPVLARRHYPGP
jgi:hypothetical protein